MTGFWLSHHHEAELNRCYRIAGRHVCARCLGTYPVLFSLLALQLVNRTPEVLPFDWPAVLLLTAPATLDWAYGQFRPRALPNWWRTLTGILLGMGLARSLYLHLRHPFPPLLLAQLGMVILVALPVILVRYRRP